MWELQTEVDGEWVPVKLTTGKAQTSIRYALRGDAQRMLDKLLPEIPAGQKRIHRILVG